MIERSDIEEDVRHLEAYILAIRAGQENAFVFSKPLENIVAEVRHMHRAIMALAQPEIRRSVEECQECGLGQTEEWKELMRAIGK